jgi:hypothetical protein
MAGNQTEIARSLVTLRLYHSESQSGTLYWGYRLVSTPSIADENVAFKSELYDKFIIIYVNPSATCHTSYIYSLPQCRCGDQVSILGSCRNNNTRNVNNTPVSWWMRDATPACRLTHWWKCVRRTLVIHSSQKLCETAREAFSCVILPRYCTLYQA